MPTEKFEELTLADLSLEPLPDPSVLNYGEPPKQPGKAKFVADSRAKKVTDRREHPERRTELRFNQDRRSGKERRPGKSWEPGKNL
jgi:hypothetical protein